MKKDDCIFCKIISGEIPSSKIYEDDDVLAFLDISQVTQGHALVVCKEHYDSFLTTPKKVMHKVMDVAQRIGQADMIMLGARGVNILTNIGKNAGQSVFHFHVHVIPRYAGDDLIIEMKENRDLEKLNLPAIAEEIKKGL